MTIRLVGVTDPIEHELLIRAWKVLGKTFWLRDGELVPMTLVEIAKTIQEFEPRYKDVKL